MVLSAEDRTARKREANRRWRAKHPDKVAECARKWREAHPDYGRHWRTRNTDKVAGYARKWREAHPEYARQWWDEHREKAAEYGRRYRMEHAEEVAEYNRQWLERNPRWRAYKRVSSILYRAVTAGRIIRPTSCSVCGKECKPEGHHPNYAKPLYVIWLCKLCHERLHMNENRGAA